MIVLLGVMAFVAMEAVSYATHRWLMHGVGMVWHRSHHRTRPAGQRFERNDLFPVCFSALGVLLFAFASLRDSSAVWAVAAGITAYGIAYMSVHDLYIHRRLALRLPRTRYLDWLREAHADHHRTGGEPYGMLLPLVRERRAASTRSARARL